MECHVKINSEVIWEEFSGLLSLQKKWARVNGGIHTINWPFLLRELQGKGIILSLCTWRPAFEQVPNVMLLVSLPRLDFSKPLRSYAKNLNHTQIEKQQTLFKETAVETLQGIWELLEVQCPITAVIIWVPTMDSKKRRRWLLNAIEELVSNFDWQPGLCMSFSSWDALFSDAIFFKKSYALKLCIGASWSVGEIFPESSLTGQFAQLHIHPN